MKKIILSSLIAVLFFSYGRSQTFTLLPRTISGVANCSGLASFQIGLRNDGSSALSLNYTRISNTLPDTGCWTQSVCDCNICHPENFIPTSDNCYIPINAGDSTMAFMVFDVKDTKGQIGGGSIKYLIYENGNISNNDTLTFNITGCLSGNFCATGINENALGQINIYPSVSNDKIYISNNGIATDIQSIVIYDGIGKAVHTEKNVEIPANKKIINIGTLPNGVYFIRLDENGFSSTKKFVKTN
jgi:hypothetical protein